MHRKFPLNPFLFSLILNLSLLLILALIKEPPVFQNEETLEVEFISSPRERIPRRAAIKIPRTSSISTRQSSPTTQTPVNIRKGIEITRSDPAIPMSIATPDSLSPDPLSASPNPVIPTSAQGISTGSQWTRGNGISSRTVRSGSGGLAEQLSDRIAFPQPGAAITGSGEALSGYYNISLVKYEDTSDTISTGALIQLAGAMNRWTKIRTKVIKEPIMLDDPVLLEVPMVYITSRRAFAFSERERENLRKYLNSGGFLLFSNAATSDAEARGVANSIEFELWKVLERAGSDLVNMEKGNQIYNSLFHLTDSLSLRGIVLDGRTVIVYEDSGYGTAWVEGRDTERQPYLKLGVNIIAHALTTSPMVQKD